MSDFNRVRAMYGNATAWSGGDHADRPDLLALRESALAEFDEVMAQHDRQVRAAAIRDAAQWLRNEMDEPWSMRFASHLEVGARREETGGSIYDPEVPA